MNSTPKALRKAPRKRGLALITVVTLLALATVLLLALFSTTQTEMAATASYADGASARQSADLAVNLVIGQLQRATRQNPDVAGREIWTSQPGLARQYRESGRLLSAHKLYSSDQMVVSSAGDSDNADALASRTISNDVPDTKWDEKPNEWVDMNEPMWRETTPGTTRLIFPIMDPRAYVDGSSAEAKERSVEGFSYTDDVKGADGGGALNGVQLSASGSASDDNQRVPMPVKWLYILDDGTLGTLVNDVFVGAGGESASVANPIVSRIAFWTDDETCKVNINTAGEGTAWNTPWLFHERDGDWARFQPMMYEYQRYPGHPATVGMSSVLFPNTDMNPPRTVGGSSAMTSEFSRALAIKETIYDLMPKILPGGSEAGSVSVKPGREFESTDFELVKEALGERLFASVDEFLLRPELTGGERQQIDLGAPIWAGLELPEVVERLHFFLTPNSRAPETNPFGLPKIAMWPLHDSASNEVGMYRTVFDQMIAKSSTIAGVEYFFKRRQSFSQDELTDIQRNGQLFNMLRAMTDYPIPGFGSSTFADKYGLNSDQILIEIFDYIRSTNLYDDTLAENALGTNPAVTGAPGGRVNAYSVPGGLGSRTFTPIRRPKNDGDVGAISMGSWPGHGQVVPTVHTVGDYKVRGMGRFPTISEAGLLFICCAEGTDRAGGASALKRSAASGDFPPVNPSSGYTPANYNTPPWDNAPRWYSNFPPLNDANANHENGFYKARYLATEGKPEFMETTGENPDHPGYNPAYWNWALEKNQPLAAGIKRVQATMLFEWFIPAAGWTLINPDFEIEVDASDLSVGGQPMFSINGGVVVVKPRNQMNSQYEIYQRGGTTSYRGFLDGRKLPAVGPMEEDTGYDNTEYSGTSIENSHRYDLISNFFDVPANGPIPFDGGKVYVRIRGTTSSGQTPEDFQTLVFNFPAGNFAAPDLIDITQEPSATQRADGTWAVVQQVPPPYWWSFYADGAIGRDENGNINAAQLSELGGRIRYPGSTTNYGGATRGNFVLDTNGGARGDTLQSLVIANGDPRVIMGHADVPESMFVPHRYYGVANRRMAHKMVMANQNAGPGIDYGEGIPTTNRFIPGSNYPERWLPDIPFGTSFGTTAQTDIRRYGDFDRGIANMEDGAYINKPDEGNTLNTFTSAAKTEESVPYFSHTWISWSGGSTYFSPNRQVSSPAMFGSLPTGVHDGGVSGVGGLQQGWRTLLFRPQAYLTPNATAGTSPHPGAPATIRWSGSTGALQTLANGGINPPDYLFMDFFWMPVVEPYAISDPGSTAGKINMNYQIVPFRHIKRATGMHAAFKGEFIHAVPTADSDKYLSRPGGAPSNGAQTWFRKDSDRNFWHREIDAEATLKLFDERFKGGFNFISPAQICEMFLLPKKVNNLDSNVPANWGATNSVHNSTTSASSIRRFWDRHRPTSDNLKERPYTRIYPKLTTRSNTFRVHVRAQTLRKARSSDPTKFDSDLDSIVGEYRGSVVVERYLDENALAELPLTDGRDYARGTAGSMMDESSRRPLDAYHRFRVLSQKSFD